jgi:hypothetical protein
MTKEVVSVFITFFVRRLNSNRKEHPSSNSNPCGFTSSATIDHQRLQSIHNPRLDSACHLVCKAHILLNAFDSIAKTPFKLKHFESAFFQ